MTRKASEVRKAIFQEMILPLARFRLLQLGNGLAFVSKAAQIYATSTIVPTFYKGHLTPIITTSSLSRTQSDESSPLFSEGFRTQILMGGDIGG